MPGVYDMFSARLSEHVGFDVVFLSGQGLSGSLIGRPDYGFLTATEVLSTAGRMAGSVNVPVVVDFDTGYGGAMNVFHTIEQAAKECVAGFILEDQEWPKKCGHMATRGSTKRVIDSDEHAEKIAAAAEARGDSDMVIIARTDSRMELGLDEAIRRGWQYRDAGADVVFIEAPQSVEEFRIIRNAFPDVPLLANVFEGTPFTETVLSVQDLEALGYPLAVYPMSPMFAAVHGMREKLLELKHQGTTTSESGQPMVAFDEYLDVIGLADFRSLEQKYPGGAAGPRGK